MLLEGGLQHAASAALFVAPAVIEEIREDRLQQAGLTASQGEVSARSQANKSSYISPASRDNGTVGVTPDRM
ncbi:hypothetical protein Q7C36_011786 [Tachysurus vachellii]|uniref:Uncharacterized protein n=1 Tax=Tachysurus vachellii TaxID=175792 RepID=A0AA88SMZ1_TACVA|nr:hypothetical protein Q7C36_011786 [Tachysurus vachellii]